MSKVDDELTRRFHRAERPVDAEGLFEGLERRRSHRERARRVQAGLLAFAVLAATLGGFAALSRAFREQPERPASPQPSGSASPAIAGHDIGLGFRLCNIELLDGIDWYGDGTEGTAWTGARVRDDGRCPPSGEGGYVIAVDLDGDGSAEQGSELLYSCLFCRPFAATDLNGDGVLELVVLEQDSSTPSYSLFGVSPFPTSQGMPGVLALFVAPPGAPQANLPADEQIRFLVGGDEGFSGGLRCENYPDAPIIEYTWLFGEVDAQTDLEVHRTRLVLRQGAFHVLQTNSFTIPRQARMPKLISTEPACGVDFHPNA